MNICGRGIDDRPSCLETTVHVRMEREEVHGEAVRYDDICSKLDITAACYSMGRIHDASVEFY